jgi:lipopolysaccharide/colanic/teichoic acid biosynthesis glycosyltransferase
MPIHLPSSRGYFRAGLSVFDTFWAALAPLLTLYVRGAYILSEEGAAIAALYCSISFVFALITFLAFRVNDGLSRYFSAHDAINILKASATAGVMTAVVLFTFTRLEGIPRSTPLIYVFILATGLISARVLTVLREKKNGQLSHVDDAPVEHIIMIGANHLSALYIKLVRSYSPHRHRVIAVVDNESSLFGRRVVGVPVVSTTAHIESTIKEFEVHGISIDRIIVGGDETLLPQDALAEVRSVCRAHNIELQFVPHLIGLDAFKTKPKSVPLPLPEALPSFVSLPRYHSVKRVIDFVISATALIILTPLFVLVLLLVLLDVGTPIVFWQQRVGRGGTSFFLYKFRTLHPPFDWQGHPAPENRRLSITGRFLRNARLDELPQLFNVLVGEMSLIGPRPLLPEDQPINSKARLLARPGVTGWAQVNGGNLVTNEEKGALDEWYVLHASPWLDLRIIALTFRFAFTGERRSEGALKKALLEQKNREEKNGHAWKTLSPTRGTVREELGPALRERIGSKARAIRVRAPIELEPVQVDQNKDL